MTKNQMRIIVSLLVIMLLAVLSACTGDKAAEQAAAAETGEKLIAVTLPANAMSENRWSYVSEGDGRVSEADWEEYQAMKQEQAGDDVIIDEIMPGTAMYIFRGEKAGDVELTFTYADPGGGDAQPEMSETFTIKVYADKTLAVVGSSLQ